MKMGLLGGLMPSIQKYMGAFTQWISKHQKFIQMELSIRKNKGGNTT